MTRPTVCDVRTILTDIEAKLDRLLAAPAAPRLRPKVKVFPAPLSQAAKDAIDVILEDVSGGEPITVRQLIERAAAYTDDLPHGGQTTHSIRCYLAEKAGVTCRWATSPGVGSGRSGRPPGGVGADDDDDEGDA